MTAYIALHVPGTESEASVIAALLDAYGVRYIMQGGAFASMYPGPLLTSLNERIVLVDENDAALARELLKPFIDRE